MSVREVCVGTRVRVGPPVWDRSGFANHSQERRLGDTFIASSLFILDRAAGWRRTELWRALSYVAGFAFDRPIRRISGQVRSTRRLRGKQPERSRLTLLDTSHSIKEITMSYVNPPTSTDPVAKHARSAPGTAASSAAEVIADTACTARRTTPKPWPTGQRSMGCTNASLDSDAYDGGVHLLSGGGASIALSLYESWYVPAQLAREPADPAATVVESGPARMGVSGFWHYPDAEPEIELAVPTFDGPAEGGVDVRLTVAEARALRDALTQMIVTLQGSSPVVLKDPELGANGPTCSDRQEVVLVEERGRVCEPEQRTGVVAGPAAWGAARRDGDPGRLHPGGGPRGRRTVARVR